MDNEINKRIVRRIVYDILILLCVGLPLIYYKIWGDPYKRGFYCDDESLKNPYKDSTIRGWMLYIIGLVVPVVVIGIIEFSISKINREIPNNKKNTNRLTFMGYEVPNWILECYQKLALFAFGAVICQLTIDFTKYSIGRLRPHFHAVCQPIFKDGTTCEDPANVGKYIEDFTCRGDKFSKRLLKELKLSFPSGHSSFTFFIMIYMILYLEKRMKLCCSSRFLRLFIQIIFIVIAWFTALSRVYDYKHHFGDIFAGAAAGTFFAIIVSFTFFERLFNWNSIVLQRHIKQK